MGTRVTGTLEPKTGMSSLPETHGGPKLTHASVTKSFQGDIEGEGTLEYLMIYHDAASAGFVGLERMVARVGDREGSFVLQRSGTFAGGTAQVSVSVVPGSGSGALGSPRTELNGHTGPARVRAWIRHLGSVSTPRQARTCPVAGLVSPGVRPRRTGRPPTLPAGVPACRL